MARPAALPAVLEAGPPVIAQSGAASSGVAVITALLVLYVVSVIVGTFRRPSAGGVIMLMTLLGVYYVGWTARGWPGVSPADGPLLGLWEAWLGSLNVMWDLFYDVSGLDSLFQRIGLTGVFNR
jgi:hypothetical protein